MTISSEEIDALKAAYEKRDDDPIGTGESYIAFHNAAEGQMPALLAAVEESVHLRAELARVTGELDQANEALTCAYLVGAERGRDRAFLMMKTPPDASAFPVAKGPLMLLPEERDAAFERGRRAGLEAAAKVANEQRRKWSPDGPAATACESISAAIRALIDHPAADAESRAVRDVIAERRRQISEEGWTPEHDDEHADGSLARAAACYASPDDMSYTDNFGRELDRERRPHPLSEREQRLSWSYVRALRWPWDWKWWKRKDRRFDLVRAGALIIAEIERLDRLEDKLPADAESEARND